MTGQLADIRHLVGASVVCVALAFAGSAEAAITKTSSGNGYEIWDVSGMEVYDLSDGETLSNVLVDQTGSGNTLTIRSRNKSNWEVKNVGFKGVGTDGSGSNSFQFQVSAPSGGSGLIENVWMNNKTRNGEQADVLGGIYIRSSHAGHIDIRHTWIEGFGNNAVYGSSVGKDGHSEGSVTIENAYHRDNTVSQFRIGSPNSVVRHSVGVVNDPKGLRGSYPSSSSKNARGIWGKHFRNQRVVDSAFYVSPNDVNPDAVFEARYISGRSNGPEAVLEVVDCEVNAGAPSLKESTSNAQINITNLGNNPSVQVIQGGGVPTSAQMAAKGGREMPPELPGANGSGGEELPKTLVIEAAGANRAAYRLTVDGEIQGASDLGAVESEDTVRTSSIEGAVEGDADGFRFSGSITDFRLISKATVEVDGSSVDPESLGDHYPHTLQIDGSDAGWTDYRFTVDDKLVEYAYLGALGEDDSIDGRTAEGFVNGGTDGYAYAGTITDFTLEGDADVLVDGAPWDPNSGGDSGGDAGADTGVAGDTGPSGDTGTNDEMDAAESPPSESDTAQRRVGESACEAAPSDGPAGLPSVVIVLLAALGLRRSNRDRTSS